jgi:hypothetical protein
MSILKIIINRGHTAIELIISKEPIIYSGKKNINIDDVPQNDQNVIVIKYSVSYESILNNKYETRIVLNYYERIQYSQILVSEDFRISNYGSIKTIHIEKFSDLLTKPNKYMRLTRSISIYLSGLPVIYSHCVINELVYLINYSLNRDNILEQSSIHFRKFIADDRFDNSYDLWIIGNDDLTFTLLKVKYAKLYKNIVYEQTHFTMEDIKLYDQRPIGITQEYDKSLYEYRNITKLYDEFTTEVDNLELSSKKYDHHKEVCDLYMWRSNNKKVYNAILRNNKSLFELIMLKHGDWLKRITHKILFNRLPYGLKNILSHLNTHINSDLLKIITEYAL